MLPCYHSNDVTQQIPRALGRALPASCRRCATFAVSASLTKLHKASRSCRTAGGSLRSPASLPTLREVSTLRFPSQLDESGDIRQSRPFPSCAHSITAAKLALPLYCESRSNIANSATAAANFSRSAFANLDPLSVNDVPSAPRHRPASCGAISPSPFQAKHWSWTALLAPYFSGSTGGSSPPDPHRPTPPAPLHTKPSPYAPPRSPPHRSFRC